MDDDTRELVKQAMIERRQEEFNRMIGCAVIAIALLAIVALTIGYWATH